MFSRLIPIFGNENNLENFRLGRVLIVGMTPCGFEVAKNLIMCGIREISVYDNERLERREVGGCHVFTDDGVGEFRFNCALPFFRRYPNTRIVRVPEIYDKTPEGAIIPKLKYFQFIIACNGFLKNFLKMEQFCFGNNIKFGFVNGYGLLGEVYVNFGKEHEYISPTSKLSTECRVLDFNSKENKLRVSTTQGFNTMEGSKFRFCFYGKKEGAELSFDPELSVFTVRTVEFGDKNTEVIVIVEEKFLLPSLSSFSCVTVKKVPSTERLSHECAKLEVIEEGRDCIYFSKYREFQEEDFVSSIEDKRMDESPTEVAKKIMGKKVVGMDVEFLLSCRGSFAPLNTLLGGILSNEVIKGLANIFSPIQGQHFAISLRNELFKPQSTYSQRRRRLFDEDDEDEDDDEEEEEEEEDVTVETSHRNMTGPELIFGSQGMNGVLSPLKLLVVGAGATGCECLKMLATLGACTTGQLTIVDPDHLSDHNTTRQLLYQLRDLEGQEGMRVMKVDIAKRELERINPNLRGKIISRVGKVGKTIGCIVGYGEWNRGKLDGVLSTVDNLEARRFVEKMCYCADVPMFNCGADGMFVCDANVSVPNVTSSFRDRSSSSSSFHSTDNRTDFHKKCTSSLEIPTTKEDILEMGILGCQTLPFIKSEGSEQPDRSKGFAEHAAFAFHHFFSIRIKKLLERFPAGQPCWSGRFVPSPLTFQPNEYQEFVKAYEGVLRSATSQENYQGRMVFNSDLEEHANFALVVSRIYSEIFHVYPPPETVVEVRLRAGMTAAIVTLISISSAVNVINLVSFYINQLQHRRNEALQKLLQAMYYSEMGMFLLQEHERMEYSGKIILEKITNETRLSQHEPLILETMIDEHSTFGDLATRFNRYLDLLVDMENERRTNTCSSSHQQVKKDERFTKIFILDDKGAMFELFESEYAGEDGILEEKVFLSLMDGLCLSSDDEWKNPFVSHVEFVIIVTSTDGGGERFIKKEIPLLILFSPSIREAVVQEERKRREEEERMIMNQETIEKEKTERKKKMKDEDEEEDDDMIIGDLEEEEEEEEEEGGGGGGYKLPMDINKILIGGQNVYVRCRDGNDTIVLSGLLSQNGRLLNFNMNTYPNIGQDLYCIVRVEYYEIEFFKERELPLMFQQEGLRTYGDCFGKNIRFVPVISRDLFVVGEKEFQKFSVSKARRRFRVESVASEEEDQHPSKRRKFNPKEE